jgi:hypothetical protein
MTIKKQAGELVVGDVVARGSHAKIEKIETIYKETREIREITFSDGVKVRYGLANVVGVEVKL